MAPGTRSSKDSKPANSNSKQDVVASQSEDSKAGTSSDSKENVPGKPLGPPPRPSEKDGDYFPVKGTYHAEPNPFEEQFGNSGTTPGKTLLPSVAALTSPSSLLPNDTPGWNSLRSGPLSPAMLAGPTNSDYFDSNYSRGFPTPNESGLRTGLTPGGGGSMFPAPSPNSTALFNSLLGAQTPNTIEFMKTGLSAKAATATTNGDAPTSQPADSVTTKSMDLKLPATTGTASDPFVHPDTDAVNGLFMLAQANGGSRAGFAVPSVPTLQVNGNHKSPPDQMNGTSSDPEMDDSGSDMDVEIPKRSSRSSRVKKPTAKVDKGRSPATKTPNNKRKRASSPPKEISPPPSSGKKEKGQMNEEEKRKNFLERNRIAALKCRQRKKQWLNNLQAKVDAYSHDNELLSQNVKALEAQVMQLRTMLIQHKDCPVTVQQGISPQAFMQFINTGDVPYMQQPMGLQPVGPLGPQGVQMMMAAQGGPVGAGGQGGAYSGP